MSNYKVHTDVAQGSEEWHKLRLGRVGGTSSAALLVKGKGDDGLGTKAIALAYQKASEQLGYLPENGSFESYAMMRGSELEPEAREAFEDAHDVIVMQVGYISHGQFIGFSPDGLYEHDGQTKLLEIKCPLLPNYLKFSHTGEIPKDHYSQMQWGLWITGFEVATYCVYHPDYGIKTKVVFADQDTHDMYKKQMQAFIGLVHEIKESVK